MYYNHGIINRDNPGCTGLQIRQYKNHLKNMIAPCSCMQCLLPSLFLPLSPTYQCWFYSVFATKTFQYFCERKVCLIANIGRWGKGRGGDIFYFARIFTSTCKPTIFWFVPNKLFLECSNV